MEKQWGGRFKKNIDKEMEKFISSLSFDKKLLKHDILGSIAHARMLGECKIITKEEKDKIVLAVNVDMVGIRSCSNGLSKGVGDYILEKNVMQIAEDLKIPLAYEDVPPGFLSDFAPFKSQSWWLDMLRGVGFNLTGGFLPQRSWFTSSHKAQVLNFSCSTAVGFTDDLAGTFLLPIGSIHGPRDTAAGIDPVSLYEQYAVIKELLNRIDSGEITVPKVENTVTKDKADKADVLYPKE